MNIVGVAHPTLGTDDAATVATIRAAAPDLLLVAGGSPKGELWILDHCEALGVPLSIQLGASFDFAAGRVRRAPNWVRRLGMEWFFRLSLEPRRLAPRYGRNLLFLIHAWLRPRRFAAASST